MMFKKKEKSESQVNMKKKFSFNKQLVIKGGICTLLIGFGLMICATAFAHVASYEKEVEQKTEQIGKLQASYKQYDKDLSELSDTARVKLYTCSDKGSAVANLQNSYQDIYGGSSDERWLTTKNCIAVYFSDDEPDASMVWYYSDNISSDAIERRVKYTWNFHTLYAFSAKTVDVVWTCVATDYNAVDTVHSGDLLAYVTAVYDVDSGVFHDVTVTHTSKGARYSQSMAVESR